MTEATFTIRREDHPFHFTGFNEHGYCKWTSNEHCALPIPQSELGETMRKIEATKFADADGLCAKLSK